jgi:hypothetical protein
LEFLSSLSIHYRTKTLRQTGPVEQIVAQVESDSVVGGDRPAWDAREYVDPNYVIVAAPAPCAPSVLDRAC